jgi:hypothetical protein
MACNPVQVDAQADAFGARLQRHAGACVCDHNARRHMLYKGDEAWRVGLAVLDA